MLQELPGRVDNLWVDEQVGQRTACWIAFGQKEGTPRRPWLACPLPVPHCDPAPANPVHKDRVDRSDLAVEGHPGIDHVRIQDVGLRVQPIRQPGR